MEVSVDDDVSMSPRNVDEGAVGGAQESSASAASDSDEEGVQRRGCGAWGRGPEVRPRQCAGLRAWSHTFESPRELVHRQPIVLKRGACPTIHRVPASSGLRSR
jgi:hypothetical protein